MTADVPWVVAKALIGANILHTETLLTLLKPKEHPHAISMVVYGIRGRLMGTDCTLKKIKNNFDLYAFSFTYLVFRLSKRMGSYFKPLFCSTGNFAGLRYFHSFHYSV